MNGLTSAYVMQLAPRPVTMFAPSGAGRWCRTLLTPPWPPGRPRRWPLGGLSTPFAWGGAGGAPRGSGLHAGGRQQMAKYAGAPRCDPTWLNVGA